MFQAKNSYKSLNEVYKAIDDFIAIDHPVRCSILEEDGTLSNYDLLPLHPSGNDVSVVLVKDGPYGLKKGAEICLNALDIQLIRSCEPIEVEDFDWKSYLDKKTA